MIGATQWTFGVHVQANMISPIGTAMAAMQTTLIMLSGGSFPVTGSALWELIIFLIRGSEHCKRSNVHLCYRADGLR